MQEYKNIDEYISNFSPEQQEVLTKIRQTIQAAAPQAKEKISYGIPTFTFHGNLVHFAAYDQHYGFYPGAAAIIAFKDAITSHETSRGTIRFPAEKPVPYDLIAEITQFRVTQQTPGG